MKSSIWYFDNHEKARAFSRRLWPFLVFLFTCRMGASEAEFRRQIQASTYQRGFFLTTNGPSARAYLGIGSVTGGPVNSFVNFANANARQIVSTTNETSLVSSALTGTNVIAANLLGAGSIIGIRTRGYLSATGAPTLRLRLKLGSTLLADSGAVPLLATTIRSFGYDATITFSSAGTNAAIIATGRAFYMTSSTNRMEIDVPDVKIDLGGGTTVDATSELAENITAQWSDASSSNDIEIYSMISEVILP